MTKATQTIDLQGFLRDPNDRALGTSRLISTICFRSPKEAPVDGIPPTSAEPVYDFASGSQPVGDLARLIHRIHRGEPRRGHLSAAKPASSFWL